MGKKTLYDEMKAHVTNVPRRPKEFEGNRASPSVIRARLRQIARDPEASDGEFLTNRFSGFRNKRGLVKFSLRPVRRWLNAQHMRPWADILRELRQNLRGIPKVLLKDFMPKVFNGSQVGFWSCWIIGELDDNGIFHSKARTAIQERKTIRLYDELDESKLPHLAEGWYIGALGNSLCWFKLVEKNHIAYMGDDGRLKIMKRPTFPQGPMLTAEEAAHFRRLSPSTQRLLCDRQDAIYRHYVKTAA